MREFSSAFFYVRFLVFGAFFSGFEHVFSRLSFGVSPFSLFSLNLFISLPFVVSFVFVLSTLRRAYILFMRTRTTEMCIYARLVVVIREQKSFLKTKSSRNA